MKTNHAFPKRAKRNRGFSLIELMIVVIIVGILAAIVYPSYAQYVRKSNRAEAQAVLMEAHQYMERWFTTNNTYVITYANDATNQFPPPLKQSPKAGNARYNISFSVAGTAAAYTLQAVPIGNQAADPCGTLTITQAGAKGAATAGCW